MGLLLQKPCTSNEENDVRNMTFLSELLLY